MSLLKKEKKQILTLLIMQENKRKILRTAVIVIVSFLFIKLIMSFKQDNNINQLTESKKLVKKVLFLILIKTLTQKK